jgi:hypothetical protein
MHAGTQQEECGVMGRQLVFALVYGLALAVGGQALAHAGANTSPGGSVPKPRRLTKARRPRLKGSRQSPRWLWPAISANGRSSAAKTRTARSPARWSTGQLIQVGWCNSVVFAAQRRMRSRSGSGASSPLSWSAAPSSGVGCEALVPDCFCLGGTASPSASLLRGPI